MAEPGDFESETDDASDDDPSARKQRGWAFLIGAAFIGCVLVYDIVTGVIYGRTGAVHRDTDPQGFWFLICLCGFGALMALFLFAASRIGDGWSDD